MKRLAIITSHPIQYNAPCFKLLFERKILHSKVFYTWSQSEMGNTFDTGFKKKFSWDIPLLDGYEYCFVNNVSKDPGTHHFNGLINPSLITEIKNWKADAVLVFGWSFQSHLKSIRYFKKKIPVFFRGDSTLLDEQGGIKQILRRRFLKWVYKHVDAAFYVGQNNKEYFLMHGLRQDQLYYAPHAIDNERFSEDGEAPGNALKWRRDLGISDDDLVILFAGKLEPKKNPSFILELAKLITSNKVHFLFVGNGILENELRSKAEGDDRIKFIGFQNQSLMPTIYRLGDVFILPSVGPGETWGLGANEAMACRLPVLLSSKAGGAIDLVLEKENGMIFQPYDHQKIADYINYLQSNRQALSAAGKRSLAHVQNFSFEKIVTAIEQTVYKPEIVNSAN